MHQYTADLANRQQAAGAEVHLVTTRHAPLDRYGPGVTVHTPVATRDRGFSPGALRLGGLSRLRSTVRAIEPDLVHITGPHLWNPLLLDSLRSAGVPTVHTLHDLHPHTGAAYGRLLYLWNGWVRRRADHLLVHGKCFQQELEEDGIEPSRLTCTPLTHLFVDHAQAQALEETPPDVVYEPWALFLGRLEAYKGLDVLIEAARQLEQGRIRIVIAGPGDINSLVPGEIPACVEIRDRLVGDQEAIDLFRRCGLLVLPYVEASQSALVAAAYSFSKPVVVTDAGALPEYVIADNDNARTGWIVPANDASALAEILGSSLRDPERLSQMGSAGRKWYERQRRSEAVTIQQMVQKLAARRVRSSPASAAASAI